VYGGAWVYGNARVSGNARVYGDAWVSGNATQTPITIAGLGDTITIDDSHIVVGCQRHTINEWVSFTARQIENMGGDPIAYAKYKGYVIGLARATGRPFQSGESGQMARPQRRTIEKVVKWLAENGMTIYTGCCDPEIGQRYFGNMDVDDVDMIIAIYERNQSDDWLPPEY